MRQQRRERKKMPKPTWMINQVLINFTLPCTSLPADDQQYNS